MTAEGTPIPKSNGLCRHSEKEVFYLVIDLLWIDR